MRVNKLKALESVEEITDYLWIDTNFTRLRSLNFLSNLRAIYGRHTMYASLRISHYPIIHSFDLGHSVKLGC